MLEPLGPTKIEVWYENGLARVDRAELRHILHFVSEHLEQFVEWPERKLLMWVGCDRIAKPGKRQRYHRFPAAIREAARQKQSPLDTRSNGPAIAAFQLAGGKRPWRQGSSNGWTVHHVYSGEFPFFGRGHTTHACKEGLHFTQSAGLVAIHPIADALCHEFALFAWLLRGIAFKRFGYDPDGVFVAVRTPLGFAAEVECEVMARGEGY